MRWYNHISINSIKKKKILAIEDTNNNFYQFYKLRKLLINFDNYENFNNRGKWTLGSNLRNILKIKNMMFIQLVLQIIK